MIKKLATVGIMAVATLAFVGAVQAQVVVPKDQEFYATPVQHGAPTDLPGERLVPGASQIATGLDTVIRPVVVDPVQGVGGNLGGGVGTVIAGLPIIGGAAPAAEPAAAPSRRRVRHARRHHSVKRHLASRKLSKKRA